VNKAIIVANTKTQADLVAKEHGLRPWQWRYAHNHHFLQGINPERDTILISSNFMESPLVRDEHIYFPMQEQIETFRALGGTVAVVAT